MKYIFVIAILFPGIIMAQSYRSLVEDGNDAYEEKNYDNAEARYKEGIREKPDRIEGHFNLGNAAYRRNDIQAALDAYKTAATKGKSKEQIAETLYNVGNSFLNAAELTENSAQQVEGGAEKRMQGYRQSIEAYKQSLKLNPKDSDARYNLVYAMKKLDELQKQNNDQDKQKQDKKDDKKEDKKDKDKDNKQDEQKKDQQDKDQQQDQQQKDKDQEQKSKPKEQQSKPEEQKISKEQAQQILKALEQDEKNLQKKVRAKSSSRVRVEKDW
jgi:Ca-activated chloride channel homolog